MKKALSVKIIVVLLIISSLQQMFHLLLGREWYGELFAYMPPWLVNVRYAFSWAQRVVGISCAFGLWHYKEIFRKITLGWGVFVIATLPWKHTFAGFMNAAEYAGDKVAKRMAELTAVYPNITIEQLTIAAMVVMCLMDIAFWTFVFYVLTRPHIKNQFH